MSGTEALALVRAALLAEDHESLEDAAERAVNAFLTSECRTSRSMVDRAIIASQLRLDEQQERIVKWAHVFEAAETAQAMLLRPRTDPPAASS